MYVTQADLVDRFGELELIERTDRADPPANIIDTAVLDMAINDANGLIDTYIKTRYPQVFASVPEPLKRKAADIARYYLYDDTPTDQVEAAYKAAIAFLKDVAAGRASLGPDQSGNQAVSDQGAEMIAPARIFGRDDTSFI